MDIHKSLKKSCLLIGMVVGAGFASGREITDYFLLYGERWKTGIAVSGALFFDQLFRLYLLADFINLVPGGGNGTVHICDMLLKILVV